MDYVTRQFVNLTKHFRKELRVALLKLSNALEKQTKAIRDSYQAADDKTSPPPEVTVINNLPSSVEVHHNEKDTSDERNYKRFMFLVTTLTLGAIAVYAALVYWQYREMLVSTSAAQDAVTEARLNRLQSDKVFKTTVEQFQLDQRAWLGLVAEGDLSSGMHIRNMGKTPAFHATDQIMLHPSKTPIDVGTWLKTKDGAKQFKGAPVLNLGVIFPGQEGLAVTPPEATIALKSPQVTNGTYTLYLVIRLEYDSFGKHHVTNYCGQWIPSTSGFDPGYGCTSWNDAD